MIDEIQKLQKIVTPGVCSHSVSYRDCVKWSYEREHLHYEALFCWGHAQKL